MIKDKNGFPIYEKAVVKDTCGHYWWIESTELSDVGLIKCRNGCAFIYWEPETLEVV